MVKTLPCPLLTGPCGYDGPVFCIGDFSLSTDPRPLDPTVEATVGVTDGIEYWAAFSGQYLLMCPCCPHL